MKTMSILYSCILITLAPSAVLADEVAEGFFGGGFLGAAIGGAAGGGRGAAIGGAVGSMLGAGVGAAARERRDREYTYYRYSDQLYEENDELLYENERLIEEHKLLFQQEGYYEWMMEQCKLGKTEYKSQAKRLSFEDDTNHESYLKWKFRSSIRQQNRMLFQTNNSLRRINAQLRHNINRLKNELRMCEESNSVSR